MLYKYDVKNERWSIVDCAVSKNNDFRRRDKITRRVFWINYFPLCAIYATDTRLIFPSLCDNYKLSCQGNIDAFRVCETFPKLFYICGTGRGHEVDGSMVEKGWRWWLRVVTGDWWKLSDPQLHSGARIRIVLFHQIRLFRVFVELQPNWSFLRFATIFVALSISLLFFSITFPVHWYLKIKFSSLCILRELSCIEISFSLSHRRITIFISWTYFCFCIFDID